MSNVARYRCWGSDYERIAAAIRFACGIGHRPLTLAEVAAEVGLSQARFQRVFTRWAGVSPDRFAQCVTARGLGANRKNARGAPAEPPMTPEDAGPVADRIGAPPADALALLRTDAALLAAAGRAALCNGKRLKSRYVTLKACTPGASSSSGAGVTIAVGEHATPFGRCLIGLTGGAVCWLSFVDANGRDGPEAALRACWPAATLRTDRAATGAFVARIFAPPGAGRDRVVRVLVRGTSFQIQVWEALLRIPPGRLATYQDVAVAIGRPSAARPVGNAVGRNPVAFVIPCHRVIPSRGDLGNYGGGVERKQAMIAWEAARYGARDRSS